MNHIYIIERTVIVGPSPSWVTKKFRALYRREPAIKAARITLTNARFICGPTPACPDTYHFRKTFLHSLPAPKSGLT